MVSGTESGWSVFRSYKYKAKITKGDKCDPQSLKYLWSGLLQKLASPWHKQMTVAIFQ